MAETVHTKYLGELRTEAQHLLSGTMLMTDAPPDNKGKGEFFSPTDLLATALGSCMITIVGINAREKGYSIDGATFKSTKIMASNPRRVSEVIIDFYFPPNNYSDREKRLIETSALNCPVALSVHPDLKQTIRFHYAD